MSEVKIKPLSKGKLIASSLITPISTISGAISILLKKRKPAVKNNVQPEDIIRNEAINESKTSNKLKRAGLTAVALGSIFSDAVLALWNVGEHIGPYVPGINIEPSISSILIRLGLATFAYITATKANKKLIAENIIK